MAFLDPETLICPQCKKSAELVWVVGEGPNTKAGEGPDYVEVMDAGPWIVETKETAKAWQGKITCPDCRALVLAKP